MSVLAIDQGTTSTRALRVDDNGEVEITRVIKHQQYYPQAGWIIDAVHQRVVPLPGHVVDQNYSNDELQRITRLGV